LAKRFELVTLKIPSSRSPGHGIRIDHFVIYEKVFYFAYNLIIMQIGRMAE
jgi:hypothetical protein